MQHGTLYCALGPAQIRVNSLKHILFTEKYLLKGELLDIHNYRTDSFKIVVLNADKELLSRKMIPKEKPEFSINMSITDTVYLYELQNILYIDMSKKKYKEPKEKYLNSRKIKVVPMASGNYVISVKEAVLYDIMGGEIVSTLTIQQKPGEYVEYSDLKAYTYSGSDTTIKEFYPDNNGAGMISFGVKDTLVLQGKESSHLIYKR